PYRVHLIRGGDRRNNAYFCLGSRQTITLRTLRGIRSVRVGCKTGRSDRIFPPVPDLSDGPLRRWHHPFPHEHLEIVLLFLREVYPEIPAHLQPAIKQLLLDADRTG